MPYKPQNNVIFYSRFSTTGNTNFSFRSYFQRIASTKELGILPSNPHCLSRQLFSTVITCRILFRSASFVTEWNGNKLTGCELLGISVFVSFLGFVCVFVCVRVCAHVLIHFLKICGWACQPALHLPILHWSFNYCWLFDLWHFEPNLALLLRQEEKKSSWYVFFLHCIFYLFIF